MFLSNTLDCNCWYCLYGWGELWKGIFLRWWHLQVGFSFLCNATGNLFLNKRISLKDVDANTDSIYAVMIVSRGQGRYSAHLLKEAILMRYENCKLYPAGVSSAMECIQTWALKQGKALQRLVARLLIWGDQLFMNDQIGWPFLGHLGVYSSWIPMSPGYNPALSSLSQVSRFRRLYQLAASSKKKHIRDLKAELEGKVDSCLSRSYMSFYVLWCVCILGHATEGHKNERCHKNPCDTFKPCLVFDSKDFTPGAHHPDDEEGEFEHEEDIGEDAASSTVATLSELCLPVPGINWV